MLKIGYYDIIWNYYKVFIWNFYENILFNSLLRLYDKNPNIIEITAYNSLIQAYSCIFVNIINIYIYI